MSGRAALVGEHPRCTDNVCGHGLLLQQCHVLRVYVTIIL